MAQLWLTIWISDYGTATTSDFLRYQFCWLNGNNSATFERIFTKFDTDIENKIPGQLLQSEFVSDKIQDGGGRHIENHFFGHNSAIIAHICSEFDR